MEEPKADAKAGSSQAELAAKLKADWAWFSTLGQTFRSSADSRLHENVKSTRLSVQGAVEQARASYERAGAAVTSVTTVPSGMQAFKQRVLDFRRQYPGLIVGVASALAVVPALRAGPGRLDKARVLVRNVVIGGGGTAVLLYPELLFRTAPYVVQGGEAISRRIGPA